MKTPSPSSSHAPSVSVSPSRGVDQFSIRTWFINHVTHHKWYDTDAGLFHFLRSPLTLISLSLSPDPHNIKRGLFFSHGFWLFKKRHPVNFLKVSSLLFSVDRLTDSLSLSPLRPRRWIRVT